MRRGRRSRHSQILRPQCSYAQLLGSKDGGAFSKESILGDSFGNCDSRSAERGN